MIKDILTEALNKLEAEEQNAVLTAIAQNNASIVQPRWQELEKSKSDAIAEVTADYNKKCDELKAQYNATITDLNCKCSKAKDQYAEEQKSITTATVQSQYTDKILKLKAIIDSIK